MGQSRKTQVNTLHRAEPEQKTRREGLAAGEKAPPGHLGSGLLELVLSEAFVTLSLQCTNN